MAAGRPGAWLAAAATALLITTAGCGLSSSTPGGTGPLPDTAAASAPPRPTKSSSARSSSAPARQAAPTAKPKARPSAPAGPATLLSRGDSGTQVRELQHRLRQLQWYAGDLSGRYAGSTVTAVRGFQDKRGIRATGVVDTPTWDALVARTRKPTADELHRRLRPGPALMRSGSSGDRVRDLQARLEAIAWFSGPVTGTYGPATTSAVQGFQGKRAIPVTGEVDQRTWDRLTAMTRTPTEDAKHNRLPKPSAAGLDPRCLTGRVLCVSKRTNSLVWVVDGHARLRTDVRFGSAELPTREGAFAVGWKSRHHVSTIYHTSMPYAMFFSGGQAVHYSPDFAARGYNGASHGCVNVRNLSAIQTLFSEVRVGDRVIVYR